MGIEDWGYRWLKRYMDAPQWLKAPLGRLYGLLPDRLRHGRDFPRYRAEAGLQSADDIARLADSRLRETPLCRKKRKGSATEPLVCMGRRSASLQAVDM